ncbi:MULTISPECIES: MBL fold metallo-hydrolase [unclassified Methanoregula]|uniref:MBL fold metallo-hydrolase n=1 Tax=unclassified Methanoregula TaxID=2649730 RepID=UPI0009D4AE07|nr:MULTISPECIES: MBL fold metallo-hydrolase [unclassified Methanoregula]OPX61655.1 MAG: putative hydrolase [Methanoregula sp. PtaB.Bin085]OPY34036.1 MAG: putative hydrolase [Methanoregula sp. PtaU1.Bin006]
MKITLLGTGDAIGTPKIGCSCPQCSHATTTGMARLRTSLLVENRGHCLLVDSSPDLRQQLLQYGSPHIDAVIWTHGHYDHFMGFGEFYRVQDIPPVYASDQVMDYCSGIFGFLSFEKRIFRPYEPFSLFGMTLTPFLVTHPPVQTCGLLFDTGKSRVGFTSDTNRNLPEQTIDLLRDLDLLLLDALVPSEITTIHKHMNYSEANALAERIRPGDFRCVHQSHLLPWDLPHCGRDGDIFEFP